MRSWKEPEIELARNYQATVEAILRLERPTPEHLYRPELDVDLRVDSIEHPDRYPLTSKL